MALTAPPALPTPTGYVELSPQWAHSQSVPTHMLLQLVWWCSRHQFDADLVTCLWVTPADHPDQHVLVDAFTAHDSLEQHRRRVQMICHNDADAVVFDLRHLRVLQPRLVLTGEQHHVEVVR